MSHSHHLTRQERRALRHAELIELAATLQNEYGYSPIGDWYESMSQDGCHDWYPIVQSLKEANITLTKLASKQGWDLPVLPEPDNVALSQDNALNKIRTYVEEFNKTAKWTGEVMTLDYWNTHSFIEPCFKALSACINLKWQNEPAVRTMRAYRAVQDLCGAATQWRGTQDPLVEALFDLELPVLTNAAYNATMNMMNVPYNTGRQNHRLRVETAESTELVGRVQQSMARLVAMIEGVELLGFDDPSQVNIADLREDLATAGKCLRELYTRIYEQGPAGTQQPPAQSHVNTSSASNTAGTLFGRRPRLYCNFIEEHTTTFLGTGTEGRGWDGA